MLEVTIINYKKGCGRESVLCVLQLSCIFVPKIYLQFMKVRTVRYGTGTDCFRFTNGWDYKNADIGAE